MMHTEDIRGNSILVYKSYGGLGDIFFTIPSMHMLKQQFDEVVFATQPRLVDFFKKNLKDIHVLDETKVNEDDYNEIIELGNYPWFTNDLEKKPQIVYHTHKKVKQHSIEHYKDGIVSEFKAIKKTQKAYPYFDRRTSDELYYTVHPGAGFLLKAWPINYYAELIESIFDYFPELTAKIIVGPNDPNPEEFFKNSNLKYELITGDIDQVADEVSGAQFHVGNDAGITHLAGAFNIPILTIYGPTGPGSWGAFSENVELIWGKRGNCNQKCNYNVILNCEDKVCLTNVKPQKMLFLLMKLVNRIQKQISKKWLLNPDYKILKEDHSFIFQSKDQEYLIDIKDESSYTFFENAVLKANLDITNMPKQFQETFNALVELGLYVSIPKISQPI